MSITQDLVPKEPSTVLVTYQQPSVPIMQNLQTHSDTCLFFITLNKLSYWSEVFQLQGLSARVIDTHDPVTLLITFTSLSIVSLK